MKKPDAVCPQCKSSNDVYKVSEIYLSGLESIKSDRPLKNNVFDQIFGQPSQKLGKRFVDQTTKRTLVSKFAPPSSSKQRVSRSIPPDFIVAVTFILGLFMLVQIYTQQPAFFLPALVIILIIGAIYLFTRKNIQARFKEKQQAEMNEKDQIEEAIGIWMKLYYCAADYIVFDQNHKTPIPLQEMNLYLASPETYLDQTPPAE